MKKNFILAIIIMITLCGCSYEGKELFSKEICNGISEVRYMDFQGNEMVYKDAETIELMSEVLQAGSYEEIGKDLHDGFYDFTFVSNGKEYGFGYSGTNIIKYNWMEYKIHNNKFHKLLSLTK